MGAGHYGGRYRPKVAVDWDYFALLCQLRGHRMHRLAQNKGRYLGAQVETVKEWARELGVEVLELVDREHYWTRYHAPLYLAKLAAHDGHLSYTEGRRLERHVRALWMLLSEFGVDGRAFLARGATPTGQAEYGKRARILTEWLAGSGAAQLTFEVLWAVLNGLKHPRAQLGRLVAEVIVGEKDQAAEGCPAEPGGGEGSSGPD